MSLPARCCHLFVIDSLTSMEDARSMFRRNLSRLPHHLGSPESARVIVDDLRTLQLLVPLTASDVSPELWNLLDARTQQAMEGGSLVWTCKHFDPKLGICGIYESRPTMCRTFPENDTSNRTPEGVNTLCTQCTSTKCKFHPATTSR